MMFAHVRTRTACITKPTLNAQVLELKYTVGMFGNLNRERETAYQQKGASQQQRGAVSSNLSHLLCFEALDTLAVDYEHLPEYSLFSWQHLI